MSLRCDSVAELVATGEPLGELSEHVATCPRCQRTVAMPARLATALSGVSVARPNGLATLRSRREVDPGLGFSARMIVGAQHRITMRKRRRAAVSLAAVTCASAFAVFVVTRTPAHRSAVTAPVGTLDQRPAPEEVAVPLDDNDLATLVELADTPRTLQVSAPWRQIETPLLPYKKLVKGVTQ